MAANYSLFNDILINYVIIILTGVSLAIRYVINSNDVHKCLDDTSDDDIICRWHNQAYVNPNGVTIGYECKCRHPNW